MNTITWSLSLIFLTLAPSVFLSSMFQNPKRFYQGSFSFYVKNWKFFQFSSWLLLDLYSFCVARFSKIKWRILICFFGLCGFDIRPTKLYGEMNRNFHFSQFTSNCHLIWPIPSTGILFPYFFLSVIRKYYFYFYFVGKWLIFHGEMADISWGNGWYFMGKWLVFPGEMAGISWGNGWYFMGKWLVWFFSYFLFQGDVCAKACDAGFWGKNCSKPCKNCYNNGKCDAVVGDCKCPAGYWGQQCEMQCEPGRWGKNCETACNCENAQSCDPSSGKCHCFRGYKGDRCETRGRYCFDKAGKKGFSFCFFCWTTNEGRWGETAFGVK